MQAQHLDKALVFYLQYNQEMTHLYEGEPDEDIDDGKLIAGHPLLEVIEAVGDRAYDEAQILILSASIHLLTRFEPFCGIKQASRRDSVLHNWAVELKLWKKKGRRPKQASVYMGLSCFSTTSCICYCWLWVRGGRANEDKLADILGPRVVKRSQDLDWNPGSVIIGEVDLSEMARKAPDMILERELVLQRMVAPFDCIKAKDIQAMLSI